MEKINVEVTLQSLAAIMEDLTLEQAIERLQKTLQDYHLQKTLGKQAYQHFTDFVVRLQPRRSMDGDGYELVINGIRLENDQEFAHRQQQALDQFKYRQRQYEQLKQEFDPPET
jgi:hypothetical protein